MNLKLEFQTFTQDLFANRVGTSFFMWFLSGIVAVMLLARLMKYPKLCFTSCFLVGAIAAFMIYRSTKRYHGIIWVFSLILVIAIMTGWSTMRDKHGS